MAEFWDIYDKNKKKVGRVAQRDVDELKDGEYHIVVTSIIMNSKNQILISKRAEYKKYGLKMIWRMGGACGDSDHSE